MWFEKRIWRKLEAIFRTQTDNFETWRHLFPSWWASPNYLSKVGEHADRARVIDLRLRGLQFISDPLRRPMHTEELPPICGFGILTTCEPPYFQTQTDRLLDSDSQTQNYLRFRSSDSETQNNLRICKSGPVIWLWHLFLFELGVPFPPSFGRWKLLTQRAVVHLDLRDDALVVLNCEGGLKEVP